MKWISVAVDNPGEGVRVLVYNQETIEIGFWSWEGADKHFVVPCWIDAFHEEICGVTHWMPLPEVPNDLD